MSALFSCQEFQGLGPNPYLPASIAATSYRVYGSRSSILKDQIRQACDKQPGIYGMLDIHDRLIYVGKAKQLRMRLLSYFRHRSRDPKAGRILGQTRTIIWEHSSSEFGALLRELDLIRRWRPRFNVHGQPHRRRRIFVCLGRKPAPYVFLARRPPAGVQGTFGPVPATEKAREAVRWLNDLFQLRDCAQSQPMIFADQVELFPILRAAGCLRFEIGTCLGPCAGACGSAFYQERVRAARAFLAGIDRSCSEKLRKDMITASAALEFERAAMLRDKIETLGWLADHLDRIRHARARHSFVYRVDGPGDRALWYLIHQGEVQAVTAAPTDKALREAAACALKKVYESRQSRIHGSAVDEVDGVFLVSAWFRRHKEELGQTMTPAEALSRIQGSGSRENG